MTPEATAYLVERARAAGYNPADLVRVMQYESSGDPTRWGGKGGNYFGLIQFGPEERAKYGVNTQQPSATNQIDATFRFLADRGYKPGMGLLDLYSTINAGSPGHYQASDGNGTVASHVAKMMGMQPAVATASSPQASIPEQEAAGSSQPETINDILLQQPTAPRRAFGGLLGLRQAMTEDEPAYDDEMKQQMNDFHRQMHEAAVAGLLGRN